MTTKEKGKPRCLRPEEVKDLVNKVKKELKAKEPRTQELPGLTPEARHFVCKNTPFNTKEIPLDSIKVKITDLDTGTIVKRDYGPPPNAYLRLM